MYIDKKNTPEKEEKRFGAFLKEKRLKHGIKLEQLSEGLCSASGLARRTPPAVRPWPFDRELYCRY